jgi:hypothetical protein
MKSITIGMLLCSVALSACGSSGGGNNSPVVVPGPGSTPTPSPSSSPTPTPSPSATYKTYAELTGDQRFKTACAAFIFNSTPPIVTPATAFGNGLMLDHAAAPDSYTITGDGVAQTYGPADRDPAAPSTVISYLKTVSGFTERFTIARPGVGGVGLDYLRVFTLRAQKGSGPTNYSCVFGVPTLVSDRPAAATVTFTRIGLGGSAYKAQAGVVGAYSLEGSSTTFAVNLTTGKVNTTIHLLGTLQTPTGPSTTNVELGTYSGVGDIDLASGSFSGQFFNPDGSPLFAYFGGWFFGPQGREAGFTSSIAKRDTVNNADISSVGTVVATQ